jgi:two-component system sensor histidine kinase ChvG
MPIEPVARFLSRISIRLLAFNLLLVFLPAAGLLYLDTYERHMLRAQERAMVQQGRLLAAALAGPDGIDVWEAERILLELRQRHQARLRVVDADGRLVSDSSRLGPERRPGEDEERPAARGQGWLYELGALPFRIYRRVLSPPDEGLESGEFYSTAERLTGPEVLAALAGRYGAITRISGGQRSVTLYAAIPIRYGRKVIGAVLVSQSTFAILQALYAVRVDIFKVVLASVAVAAVLSLLVSTTIARPLRRLRDQARAITDRRGRLQGDFPPAGGRDEIGDLSRALAELTARLRRHIEFIESFASDVSHEFKNPLASIRTATEVLSDVDDAGQRRRFLRIVEREIARMERLLTGVREITRIDARLGGEEMCSVDLDSLLGAVVEAFRLKGNHGVAFDLEQSGRGVRVHGSPDRLAQVFENLLDNALSFSPPGARIRVDVAAAGGEAVVSIADQGPGVAAEIQERIFGRFFSYRPGAPGANGHAGLGLPIAKAIVEAHGGTILARCAETAGAVFEVRLPTEAGG